MRQGPVKRTDPQRRNGNISPTYYRNGKLKKNRSPGLRSHHQLRDDQYYNKSKRNKGNKYSELSSSPSRVKNAGKQKDSGTNYDVSVERPVDN